MKPYFTKSGITIYHARAEEVLPSLPANSVDLLLTDPPYGIAYKSRAAHGRFNLTVANAWSGWKLIS